MSEDADLSALENKDYPGRFIALGLTTDEFSKSVIAYGITGRSPPSQARRLVYSKLEGSDYQVIKVEVTDPEQLKKGNPDLLVYNAMIMSGLGVVVSNGRHTDSINRHFSQSNISSLSKGLADYEFEPDKPNYTPRIAGIAGSKRASLAIIRRADNGRALRNFFSFPMLPGKAWFISTYQGTNTDPLFAYEGDPEEIDLRGVSARENAQTLYEAINPDFRVSVAVVHRDFIKDTWEHYIVNHHDLKEDN